ncbi:MAG: glycosyltransferase family A protein [Phycisphaerae bacterium]
MVNGMPLVSVIIPTYKHQDYVLESIASVRAQTFTDWELIVVNDGSPDDTHHVLQPLADAGVIRYLRQENQGQARARNRGLAEARGEFIAFLDDDDCWPADSLAWRVAALRDRPELGVICGVYRPLGTTELVGGDLDGRWIDITFAEVFNGCPCVSPGQALIRAGVLREAGGFDPTLWGTDDYDLWMRLSRVTKIQRHHRLSLYYRFHDTNASRNSYRMFRNCWRVIRRGLDTAPPTERRTLARQGCRALYQYHALQLTWEWRQQLLRAEFGKCGRSLEGLAQTAWIAAQHDRPLLGRMARDLLVRKLREALAAPAR